MLLVGHISSRETKFKNLPPTTVRKVQVSTEGLFSGGVAQEYAIDRARTGGNFIPTVSEQRTMNKVYETEFPGTW